MGAGAPRAVPLGGQPGSPTCPAPTPSHLRSLGVGSGEEWLYEASVRPSWPLRTLACWETYLQGNICTGNQSHCALRSCEPALNPGGLGPRLLSSALYPGSPVPRDESVCTAAGGSLRAVARQRLESQATGVAGAWAPSDGSVRTWTSSSWRSARSRSHHHLCC